MNQPIEAVSPKEASPESPASSKSLDRYRTADGARDYATKYERSWSRRRTNRREESILRSFMRSIDASCSLLNVACGTGRFTEILKPGTRSSALYADFSPEMLDKARKSLAQSAGDDVQFAIVDVTASQAETSHDLVVCIRCLHHLPETECNKALDFLTESSADRLIFTVASTSTWKGWWRAHRSRIGSRQRGEHLVSRSHLQEDLKNRGFEIETTSFVSRLFSSQMWVLARRHAPS